MVSYWLERVFEMVEGERRMDHIAVVLVITFILAILDGMATFIPMICRNNKPIEEDESLTTKEEREWINENAKIVGVKSQDGLRLKAYEFKQKKEAHVWVILVHGYRINALMAVSPKFIYDKGWNVLCPDLRAHGKSEGKYIGMGWLDRKDILMWIHKIIKADSKAEIVLYGGSMGGATVMMTAGEVLPKQVKCGISDSGFTSAWDLAAYILKTNFHLPAFPTLNLASIISKVLVGFSFKEASAVNQLKKSTLPMLFIHGTKDHSVPYEMLERVYEAAAGEKEKLVIEEAGHMMSYRLQPDLYWKRVFDFVEKYTK